MRTSVECPDCGEIRELADFRPSRQSRRCAQCAHKPENNGMYRGVAKAITCADCGKQRKWWPRPDIREPVRCTACKGKEYIGDKNPNWKGGITGANKKLRNSPQYAAWRQDVFARDGFTCQWCGQVGGDIHADHIEPFAIAVDLRFDVDNGRTLCRPCHLQTESYLGGARKLQAELAREKRYRGQTTLPFDGVEA